MTENSNYIVIAEGLDDTNSTSLRPNFSNIFYEGTEPAQGSNELALEFANKNSKPVWLFIKQDKSSRSYYVKPTTIVQSQLNHQKEIEKSKIDDSLCAECGQILQGRGQIVKMQYGSSIHNLKSVHKFCVK